MSSGESTRRQDRSSEGGEGEMSRHGSEGGGYAVRGNINIRVQCRYIDRCSFEAP